MCHVLEVEDKGSSIVRIKTEWYENNAHLYEELAEDTTDEVRIDLIECFMTCSTIMYSS